LIQINGEGRRVIKTMSMNSRDGKPAMTPAEYAKAYLSSRREDLTLRLLSVERSRQHRDFPLSRDSEERAAESENDEVLDQLADTTRDELARVDHAMRRLDSGHYGECERCGSPIGEARLHVVPEATLCPRCAKARTTL
jgi:RNA polymerase-binding transcription factor DksA